MCGIVGTIVKDGIDKSLINEMLKLINHRGPDEQTIYSDGHVAIGFARLSIIDPEQGHQPVYNESQSIVTVCNGEIYNHLQHRVELDKLGHKFNSHSDVEVIPHLYETFGEKFVEHLHGMFAITLYDASNSKLILARDHFGKKPLYYLQTEHGFFFSSEFKTFLLIADYIPTVNRLALDRLLTFKHIPGEDCLLKDVRALQPGHMLIFDVIKNSFIIKPYYTIPNQHPRINRSINFDTAKKEVCRLFDEAVEKRLMTDVPFGVALSGGLDSSAVVASVAKQVSKPPKTFFVNIGEAASEIEYARMVADRYQTDHHEIQLTPGKLHEIMPKVIWHLEEPMSVAEISTYYLGMMVSEHVKVLLCGEGSDELFGGYSRFQPLNMFSMLPKSILKWGYVRGMNGFTRQQRKSLYSTEQLKFLNPNSNPYLDASLALKDKSVLNQFLHYELTQQLPNLQLMRVDKLIMAHSVEPRAPFLDVNLVNYVANLPSNFKVQGFREKVLLKMAMTDSLPAPVIQRRKLGFSNPVKALFKTDFRDIFHNELYAEKDTVGQFFSYRGIEKLFSSIGKGFLTQPEMKLFHIYLFLKWHQLFIEGKFRT